MIAAAVPLYKEEMSRPVPIPVRARVGLDVKNPIA
jgi:hypothetical protein